MGTVAMLMPNRQLAETAEKILAEGEFPYKAIVRTVDRTNALEVLKELPDIDLIISRGRIAMMIEEAVDIPVIPIISNAQEVGLLVLEAKRLSGKEMPLIALVGFENAYCDVSHFHELFNVEIRVYQAPFDAESNDVRQIVSRALADGVDAAICGSRSQRLWEEAGIPFVLFRTGEESLREAFHIARITHYAHELQKKNTARLQTLIDSLTSAVIELDTFGCIVSYNHVADENFHFSDTDSVGRPLPEKLPFIDAFTLNKTLEDGEEVLGTGKYPGHAAWIYNIVPLAGENGIDGAIAILQETNAVERMDRMSRRETHQNRAAAQTRSSNLKVRMADCPEIYTRIRAFSASTAPVLISGEQGLESREIAYAVHNSGAFAKNPFVAVNCAELSEKEQIRLLFGDEAFQGYCLNAHQGTLFLNRAECLSREAQMRLLRIIEENTVLVGSDPEPVPLSVRVLSYIPDPQKALASGMIVAEFLTALSVLMIRIPPLRERPNDLQHYLNQFIKGNCKKYGRIAVLTSDAAAELMNFSWPGNLRQMAGFCEKMILTMRHRSVNQGDIVSLLREIYVSELLVETQVFTGPQETEAQQILSCLEQCQWRRDEAARALGVSRSTLWRKINQYGLMRK